MRKSAAFFLLTCFGLYHLGFFALQVLMPLAIHQHWENKIWEMDPQTLGGKLLKIPFPMPYGQNQENFQPVNFMMKVDGKISRVIQQRYFEDHLEVIVVEDELHTNFEDQIKRWISTLGTDPGDFDGPPLQKLLLKSFVKDYVLHSLIVTFSKSPEVRVISPFSPYSFYVPKGFKSRFLDPPRVIFLT
ncbi:hypothetical protein [Algoriphagus sp. A40]|uniref:hypothetical protein n=1 Tax=Algoriphagus sp. A40 TaxID=1945863 RepID=UPI00098477E7|nr:hypothetical protein [Algoriphagus sp. A40]OOG72292.1 hypothetical protein B0E43_15435 [Algoriphagus sp. A40]